MRGYELIHHLLGVLAPVVFDHAARQGARAGISSAPNFSSPQLNLECLVASKGRSNAKRKELPVLCPV